MKIFVTDKRTVLSIFGGFAAVLAIASCIRYGAAAVSVNLGRHLPVYSVETPEKAVSVTFDAAWNDSDIDDIIEILKKYNCSATFFVVGDWAEKYPDAVKKLHAAGHEIANHSDSHAHYSELSAEEMKADMDECDKKIEALTGEASPLFRAPYGEYNDSVVTACNETGRYCIQWDIDSLDWKGLSTNEMKSRILPNLQNGSIILFHNGTENTAAALPDILESIIAEGYSFKTAGQLIYRENYQINHEGRQIPLKEVTSDTQTT